MPTVPRYDNTTQQTAPLRAPQASPGAFAEGPSQLVDFGQGLGQAGNAATRIALDIQDRENTDRVLRAETSLKEAETAFHNDISQRQGQNAYGVTEEAKKWWGETANKQAETLTNPAQRLAFDRLVAERRSASIDFVSRHEAGQRRRAVEDAANASIATSIDAAVAGASDPSIVDLNRRAIERTVRTAAQTQGWAPEVTAQKLSEQLTALHKGVISAKAEKSPFEAQAYYDLHKEEIAGSERPGIEKGLKAVTQRGAAQAFEDRIMSQGLTEADALARARDIKDPEVRDSVVSRVKTRFAESDAIRQDNEREASRQAWGIVAAGKGVDAIPPGVWSTLDGKEQIQLQAFQAKRASGEDVQTNWTRYYELRKEATENPTAFTQRNLLKEFDQLDGAKRKELIELQEKTRRGDTDIKDVATLEQQLSTAHSLMGWKTSDAETKGKFDSQAYDALNAEEQRAGRKLNFKERQEVIDRLLISGEVRSGAWYAPDSDRRFFEVRGTTDESQFVPDVPTDERAKIEDALKRANRPVTDENVLRLYRMKKGL